MSLTSTFGINEQNLEIRRRFIRLDEDDRQRLLELKDWAEEVAADVAREFYDFQFSFPRTKAFFDDIAAKKNIPLPQLRQALEAAQAGYFREVFRGAESNWGVEYFEKRLFVGATHDRINLPFKWYIGSYTEYMAVARKMLDRKFPDDPAKVLDALLSLSKVFNYDMQAIGDSFLLTTLQSVGIDVESVEAASDEDRTEHVGTMKEQIGLLMEQISAIAQDQLDEPCLDTAVPGRLGFAFKEAVTRLRSASDDLRDLAEGTIPEFLDDSVQGTIAGSVHRTRHVIRDLIGTIEEQVERAQRGELKSRIDSSTFKGAFRKQLDGINTMLDRILEPMNHTFETLDKMAQGDLTARIEGEFEGDHKQVQLQVNSALESMESTFGSIVESVVQVKSASGQIADGAKTFADGANMQAASIEQISSSIEQMSATVEQNADNAQNASGLAHESRTHASAGGEAMTRMIEAIQRIKDSSDQTAKIVKTIDQIASQTNLLALNAAVEAARAGDAGRGFAVVAEEVRNLAQRTTEAARSTSDMISDSVRNADSGVRITSEVNQVLKDIVQGTTSVNDLVAEIARSSKEQAEGVRQINAAVADMDRVTQSNAAGSEQSAGAAQSLDNQMVSLNRLVSRFRIGAQAQSQF